MTYEVEQHIALKRVSDIAASPCGTWLAVAVQRFGRYAPVRYVKNRKTPVLIIHGERDYRCPISEGLNLFEALQYFGVESELLVFPDENHWILKPRNIVAWYEAALKFIGRHRR